MISDMLAGILRSGRPDFNTRFNEARQRFPGLDANAFTSLLQEIVDPVVVAVAGIRPECAAETASVAYDVALELAGQNLAGPAARTPVISAGLRRLLPVAARHLAEAPRSILPAVSNALHHLGNTPGASPDRWINDMGRLAGECADANQFLTLGKVAAWRAGLAHYRASALALLEGLPERLALGILGVPEDHDSGLLKEILQSLKRNPWYDPAAPAEAVGKRLRPVRTCGTFRGFGGLFVEPPRVAVNAGDLLVQSGGECWLLTADRFGATFHHCDPEPFAAASRQRLLPDGLRISGSSIHCNGESLELGFLGEISSAAATGETLALTSPLTHAVVLVALQ